MARHFNRRNTDETTWDQARAVAETWEKAGSWVPERQERLTGVLKAAFGERTKPNLAEMPKKTA